MSSTRTIIADKGNILKLKQVDLCPDNVFPTRFTYQVANSFADDDFGEARRVYVAILGVACFYFVWYT
jgi:hypothetical protein